MNGIDPATCVLVFAAGAVTAVAVRLMVEGIAADRREWRRLDAVQAEIAARYPADVRDLTGLAGPSCLDERVSVWRVLAHRGEDLSEAAEPARRPPMCLPWAVLNLTDHIPTGDRLAPLVWTSRARHRLGVADGTTAQVARWNGLTGPLPCIIEPIGTAA